MCSAGGPQDEFLPQPEWQISAKPTQTEELNYVKLGHGVAQNLSQRCYVKSALIWRYFRVLLQRHLFDVISDCCLHGLLVLSVTQPNKSDVKWICEVRASSSPKLDRQQTDRREGAVTTIPPAATPLRWAHTYDMYINLNIYVYMHMYVNVVL